MAYVTSPYAPRARRLAVQDVRTKRLTVQQASRRYGVHRITIWRWVATASPDHRAFIENKSSAPHSHTNQLPAWMIERVIAVRKERKRCAVVVHHQLEKEGLVISLSSVKRIFKRNGLTRKGKRPRLTDTRFRRPPSTCPGALVEMDTIHFVTNKYQRFYVYSIIDTFSRFAYVEFQPSISPAVSCQVIDRALRVFPFPIQVIQTDHGQEFSFSLEVALRKQAVRLRHTRVKKPNDNAHIERFNRTLQEECFDGLFPEKKTIQRLLEKYVDYYNNKRLHLGIECITPQEMLQRC